jgi:hypothetical protein
MTQTLVYPVRPGDDNEELRYSLRSLGNRDVEVIIVGHRPWWVKPDLFIPGNQEMGKWHNVPANIRLAARELTGEMIVMNDDFFLLSGGFPMIRHRSDMVGHAGNCKPSAWRTSLEAVYEVCGPKAKSYELHEPFRCDAEKMVTAIDVAMTTTPLPAQWRSVYGNLYAPAARKGVDQKWRPGRPIPTKGWLSTSDRTWAEAGKGIRERFTTPSRWER